MTRGRSFLHVAASSLFFGAIGFAAEKAEAVSTHIIADVTGNSGYIIPSNGIGGDSPADTQSALSAGYSFTVDEEGFYFTDLAKISGGTGATETVSLYNLTIGELVVSVTDVADTHREYEFYEFDSPIEAIAGHEYAIVANYTADSDVARLIDDLPSVISYFSNTSPFTYENTLALADSEGNPIFDEYGTPGQDAFLEFFYNNGNSSFTQGLEPQLYGGVDFGFASEQDLIDAGIALPEQGIAVPAPAAAGIGMAALGLLSLRRRQKN